MWGTAKSMPRGTASMMRSSRALGVNFSGPYTSSGVGNMTASGGCHCDTTYYGSAYEIGNADPCSHVANLTLPDGEHPELQHSGRVVSVKSEEQSEELVVEVQDGALLRTSQPCLLCSGGRSCDSRSIRMCGR